MAHSFAHVVLQAYSGGTDSNPDLWLFDIEYIEYSQASAKMVLYSHSVRELGSQ